MTEPSGHSPAQLLLSRVGWVVFLLMGFAIPLGCAPPSLFILPSVTAPVRIVKDLLILGLSSGLFALVAARCAVGRERYPTGSRLAGLFAALLLGWCAASALASPAPMFSLRAFAPTAAMLAVVIVAPLFLTNERRVRVLLYAMTASAIAVGLIAALPAAGLTQLTAFFYGADLAEMIRSGEAQAMGTVIEGGLRRAVSLSTLGNPEYTGNYLAGAFVLIACWLIDGWGGRRARPWWMWGLGIVAMGVVSAGIVATATRGAAVVALCGATVRWLIVTRIRGSVIAAGLAVVLVAGFIAGPFASLAVLALAALLAVIAQHRSGDLASAWSRLERRVRVALLLLPLVLALGATAAVVRGGGDGLLGRLSEVGSTRDRSLRERLQFYMLAAEMVRQHPLLGVGPGNYGSNFYPSYVRLIEADDTGVLELARRLNAQWLAERTHNDYFQIASEIGLPGLALFLGLATAVLTGLARLVRASDDESTRGLAATIATATCAYMAMMLTSFPLQESARLSTFYLLVAAGMALPSAAAEGSPTTS